MTGRVNDSKLEILEIKNLKLEELVIISNFK